MSDSCLRLKDKVALVTGATSGIGKAIAQRFAAEGARVCVNFRPAKNNREIAEELAGELNGIAVPADVSVRASVHSMVDIVLERYGRLDVVVNNAGIEQHCDFLEITDEHWERMIGVNLYGPFLVSQEGARAMVRLGNGGSIVNISSVHEDVPFAGYAPYCCAKGGLRMLMRNLALELAPRGIRVNNIAPGAIATPINAAVLADPDTMAQATSEIPLGRFGRPGEVASVAVFLASDEASYVTGGTYYVDGGLVQQVTRY